MNYTKINNQIYSVISARRGRGISVSIVPDYELDDRAIGVRSPAVAKYFSCSLCVQTGSGAYRATYPMGTGDPFPGVKRGRGVTLTTQHRLVPRSRMNNNYYTFSPLERLHGASHGRFLIIFTSRYLVGLLWTSDKPVTKASTYTGEHNTERRGKTSMSQAGFKPTISASKRSRLSPQTARPLGQSLQFSYSSLFTNNPIVKP
jgi:hypothetical protein